MVNCKICGVETGEKWKQWCATCFPTRDDPKPEATAKDSTSWRIARSTALAQAVNTCAVSKKAVTSKEILGLASIYANYIFYGMIPEKTLDTGTKGAK